MVDHPSPPLAERPREPYAVLSCGGGAGGLPALLASMDAFGRLSAAGGLGPMRLVVFAPAFASSSDMAGLQAAACRGPFTVRPFAEDFDCWLRGAVLSVSRAGYNTCAGLLRAKVRAILLPDPVMADQAYRARRWADLGLAAVASGEPPAVAAIMAAAQRALAATPISCHCLPMSCVHPKPDEEPAPLPCAISGTGAGSRGAGSRGARVFSTEGGL